MINRVEFLGLPTLSAALGKKIDLDWGGGSVSDLIGELVAQYGQPVKKGLLHDTGALDHSIQVIVNDEGFMNRDQMPHRELSAGDKVMFLLVLGGG